MHLLGSPCWHPEWLRVAGHLLCRQDMCLQPVTGAGKLVASSTRIKGRTLLLGLLGCVTGDDVHDRRRVCMRGPHRL